MTQLSRYALYASGVLALGLLPLATPGQEEPAASLLANCDEFSGNARRDETICVGFRFSDGTNEISAGLAATSRFDFEGSLWRLTDGVRLSSGTTEILADEALARFEANELVLGELSGNPVTMSDFIEERDTPVSGSAISLSYDSRTGDVHLTGEATLIFGDNEVKGCEWIYNVFDKTYGTGAAEDCAEGIRMLLTPPEEEDAGNQTESP